MFVHHHATMDRNRSCRCTLWSSQDMQIALTMSLLIRTFVVKRFYLSCPSDIANQSALNNLIVWGYRQGCEDLAGVWTPQIKLRIVCFFAISHRGPDLTNSDTEKTELSLPRRLRFYYLRPLNRGLMEGRGKQTHRNQTLQSTKKTHRVFRPANHREHLRGCSMWIHTFLLVYLFWREWKRRFPSPTSKTAIVSVATPANSRQGKICLFVT